MLERAENDKRIAAIWEDVQRLAPTDADALDIFYKSWHEHDLVRCLRCNGSNISRNPGEREGQCNDCGEACWVTSGTILQRASLFQGYLAAAIICEEGLTISAPEFHRLTGIPQTSSYNIFRKLRLAVCNQMPSESQEFSGQLVKLLIAKRSLETPANCHPFTEQELIEEILFTDTEPSSDDAEDVNNAEDVVEQIEDQNLSEYDKVKKVVKSLLSEVGLTADKISVMTGFNIGKVIASLSELELFGEARIEPGGKYFKISSHGRPAAGDSVAGEIIEAVAVFFKFVDEYFHRVGRKSIQTYLAALWCALDRDRWGPGSIIRLFGAHPPVPYRQVRDYVSPPLLKIMVG